MINKESPSLENINKPQNSHRVNFGKTIGAITLIGALTLGQVGCSEINAISPTSITETTEKPTDPLGETAINTTPGSETVTITIPNTKPTTEAPTTIPTTKPTTEAPTTKPTTEAPTTIPTTKPTTEAPTTTPTTSELEGVAAERLQFTKDLLNLYDNSVKDSNSAFNKIKDFVTREQIINYGKTGEGLTVVKHENNTPAVALINCNSKVVTAFNGMLNEIKKYDKNFLESLTGNGLVAFMVNRYDESMSSTFTYNKSGLVIWNLDPAKNVISANLRRPVATECFGVKMLNLGGDYAKYAGFLKEQLSSDCWWNLYKKTNEIVCRDTSYGSYMFCKDYYNNFYAPETFKDQKIQDLLKKVRDNNLAVSFGGTWSEITTSIGSRPNWQGGEIQ